ncbi:Receptor-type tyrosine-protein phosphatase S, partial [Geodia barretti]
RISYTGGGSSGSETVSGGDTNSYILTGLTNGETYIISIVAISSNLDGDNVTVMAVGLVPGRPTTSLDSTTATTISLSWSVPSGSVVTEYLIEWTRDTSVGCSDGDTGSTTITATSHTIPDLEEDSRYTITVTASNGAGSSEVSSTVTVMTREAAPPAPPSDVTVTDVTSSTITVQWGEVPCIHQNGAITGYSVQYGVMGSGSTQIVTVDGATMTETTIENLTPSTTYSIEVAAVNNAGTGVYST